MVFILHCSYSFTQSLILPTLFLLIMRFIGDRDLTILTNSIQKLQRRKLGKAAKDNRKSTRSQNTPLASW